MLKAVMNKLESQTRENPAEFWMRAPFIVMV